VSTAGGTDVGLLVVLHDGGVKVVDPDVVGETTAGERQEACLCGVVVLYAVLVDLNVSRLVDLFVETAEAGPGETYTEADEPVLVSLRNLGTVDDLDVVGIVGVDHTALGGVQVSSLSKLSTEGLAGSSHSSRRLSALIDGLRSDGALLLSIVGLSILLGLSILWLLSITLRGLAGILRGRLLVLRLSLWHASSHGVLSFHLGVHRLLWRLLGLITHGAHVYIVSLGASHFDR